MEKIYAEPGLRKTLREMAVEQAKRFSWERCARETVEVFAKALADDKIERLAGSERPTPTLPLGA
jgi:hypothetical protein